MGSRYVFELLWRYRRRSSMRRIENQVVVKDVDIVSLSERRIGALPKSRISGESRSTVLGLDSPIVLM
jgi:hypothetical protein